MADDLGGWRRHLAWPGLAVLPRVGPGDSRFPTGNSKWWQLLGRGLREAGGRGVPGGRHQSFGKLAPTCTLCTWGWVGLLPLSTGLGVARACHRHLSRHSGFGLPLSGFSAWAPNRQLQCLSHSSPQGRSAGARAQKASPCFHQPRRWWRRRLPCHLRGPGERFPPLRCHCGLREPWQKQEQLELHPGTRQCPHAPPASSLGVTVWPWRLNSFSRTRRNGFAGSFVP